MVADGNAPTQPAGNPGRPPHSQRIAPDPVADVGTRVREVVEFASYYLAAQVDRFKLTAINIAMFAALGLIAVTVGVAVVFTAAGLLIVGIAHALGALCGHMIWLGELITSLVILGVLFGGTVIGFKIVTKSTRGKVVASYEQRKSKQRADLGTDVERESNR